MSREILEITPSGGIYCVLPFTQKKEEINCTSPNGYSLKELIQQLRLGEDNIHHFATDGDILRWGIIRLCESPIARALAHDARFDDWTICLEDSDIYPHLDLKFKSITLSRHAESVTVFARTQEAQMKFLTDLVRALRLIWQSNMTKTRFEELDPENYIRYMRLLRADADLSILLTAYQLRERGEHDIWRFILASDLHPLAITLCECLDVDASTDGMLDALGFIFTDWFDVQGNLERSDQAALYQLDIQAETSIGYAQLAYDDVLQLSMLPDGFSYLEYVAADFLSDDFYSAIEDQISKAHLAQIVEESRVDISAALTFRDQELAKKFLPSPRFETVV